MIDPAQRWRTAAVAAASLLPAAVAGAADPTVADLLERIEEQDQKILVLERKLEIQDDADRAAAASAPAVKASERGFPTSLVPNRDLGLQLGGNLLSDRINYAVAFVNGSNEGSSSETFGDVDLNDDTEWAARVFVQPFGESDQFALRRLGIGIAGTYTDQGGTAVEPLLPTYRTPAQAMFFRYRTGNTPTLAWGERLRLAPQLYYSIGSLGLLGEHTAVSQDVARDGGGANGGDRSTEQALLTRVALGF